jgi:hypothetical protein
MAITTILGIKHRIHMWEPINGKFFRACVAEFLAMLLFVLLCCGCAMVGFDTIHYACMLHSICTVTDLIDSITAYDFDNLGDSKLA